MSKCDFNKVALQLYWNHNSAWVFSDKFAAYFQNTFLYEQIWTAASAVMQNILNTETKINLRIQNIIISLRRDKRACDRSFRCDSVLKKLLLDQLIKNYFSDLTIKQK